MSTSLSPRPSGSLGGSGHPTRQQLDELDALLQRMLALPVNQPAEEVTAEMNALPKTVSTMRQEAVSYRTADDSADTQTAVETDATDTNANAPRLDNAHVSPSEAAKEEADSWVPLSSTWKPSPHTWKPLAQSWQQPRATPSSRAAQESPSSREEPVEGAAPGTTPPAPVVPAKTEPKAPIVANLPASVPEEPLLAVWLRALLWVNLAFDVLLLPWGAPGRWLRRDGAGRSLLGLIGILLLLAALGLSTLEWFGWTWDDLLARIP
jgi:hypothetical protein